MQLPQAFIQMLATLPGYDNVADALMSTPPAVAVRFSPTKAGADIAARLAARDLVPWSDGLGLYLDTRPQFTFDPALYYGCYYVQDPSSMILGHAVRLIAARDDMPKRPLRYLDACAAPGGKTGAAIDALPPGSFVMANEYDPTRIGALVENLERRGYPRYAVSRADARQLGKAGPLFDIVAIDVPCSGEGMMRKNETAVTQWSPGLIQSCAALQRQIADAVWNALAPGGYLIYSTCTFNTAENEENIDYICRTHGALPVDLHLDAFPGVLPAIGDRPGARFAPGRIRGEGLFISVLQKPGALADNVLPTRNVANTRGNTLPPWLDGAFTAISGRDGALYAVADDVAPLVATLAAKTNIIVPGIHVANPKGRDLAPAHPLAAATALRRDAFATADVDYPTAIEFLHGQALTLDAPTGYLAVTYRDLPLGFVKNLGRRANNQLPANRRIRTAATPAGAADMWRMFLCDVC